jgi:hypothetical protein
MWKENAIMNITPQVETREISDADLDNVSGGVGGTVGGVLATAGGLAGVDINGILDGALGTVSGIAGIDVNSIVSSV